MLKWLRRIAIALCAIALFVLFAWCNGIQFALAVATWSFPHSQINAADYIKDGLCGGKDPCPPADFKVLTFNVLCRVCEKEGYETWDQRVPHLVELIKSYDPDLLGMQELGGKKDIVDVLGPDSPYDYVTHKFGPWLYADCALFYKHARFELLDSGQIWFSPHPWLPFAFAWKPLSMPRYANWAILRDRESGLVFLFANTHFDNNGPNKERTADMFGAILGEASKTIPVIVTGDFNTPPGEDRFRRLLDGGAILAGEPTPRLMDTATLASNKQIRYVTPEDQRPKDWQEFAVETMMIDHIITGGPEKTEVSRWEINGEAYGGGPWFQPSDHPAIFAEFKLAPQ